MSLNFRLAGLLLVTIGAAWYSYRYFGLSIRVNDVVKVDGVMNIWGAYATFIIALFATINTATERFDLPCPRVQGNIMAVVIILMIAPILTYITHAEIEANIKNYVECKDQREFWSRYSSRTYAKTKELCLSIK